MLTPRNNKASPSEHLLEYKQEPSFLLSYLTLGGAPEELMSQHLFWSEDLVCSVRHD